MRPREPAVNAFEGEAVVFTGRMSSVSRAEACRLVSDLGGTTSPDINSRTTVLVVGSLGPVAEGAGPKPRTALTADHESRSAEEDTTRKLRRVQAINARQPGKVRILEEEDFCRLAGLPSPAELRQQWYALHDILARYPCLREDHLRYLQKWNLVRPAVRTHGETYFAFGDLATLRQANAEMARGASFRAVVRSLQASREGQLRLEFWLDAEPAKIVRLTPPRAKVERRAVDSAEAEEHFLLGASLDDGDPGKQEAAGRAYRRALALDPCLVPALVNLANIHYARENLVEAEALYQRAISLDPGIFEAHFNLGNVYHDLGQLTEARSCYEEALALNPGYAEAHFYLAVTLEKLGSSAEAKPHWRRYRDLAPDGEWVELAREFSE